MSSYFGVETQDIPQESMKTRISLTITYFDKGRTSNILCVLCILFKLLTLLNIHYKILINYKCTLLL